jgi:hypothetical protein
VTDTDGVLCSIGTIDITRAGGQSKFKIQPDELFDAEVEDLLWTVDTNKDSGSYSFASTRSSEGVSAWLTGGTA